MLNFTQYKPGEQLSVESYNQHGYDESHVCNKLNIRWEGMKVLTIWKKDNVLSESSKVSIGVQESTCAGVYITKW